MAVGWLSPSDPQRPEIVCQGGEARRGSGASAARNGPVARMAALGPRSPGSRQPQRGAGRRAETGAAWRPPVAPGSHSPCAPTPASSCAPPGARRGRGPPRSRRRWSPVTNRARRARRRRPGSAHPSNRTSRCSFQKDNKNRPNCLNRNIQRKRLIIKQFGRFLWAYPVQSVHAPLIHRVDLG